MGMHHHAFAHLPEGISPSDAQRIAAGCSHALVPDQPAARGYRYVDLGGAPAVAQVKVSVGLNTLRWDRMLDVDLVSGVWAELLGWALSEVAGLDLLDAASCPICGPIS